MEGAESPVQALPETDHGRQGSEEGYNRSRTRTARIHMGDRHQGRGDFNTTKCCMKTKAKTFPTREKAKTLNNAIQLEDKVSCSRSKHEGEPSTGRLRQAYGQTRGSSQRQLPTDHDYAVSTREYQLDQSSPLTATAAADPVLVRKKRPAHLDRSLHINFRVGGDTAGIRLGALKHPTSRLAGTDRDC